MSSYPYVGLDVHKKTISYCVKRDNGEILDEGVVPANRRALAAWAQQFDGPWHGGMEATLFSGWVHEVLLPYAETLKVGHPYMLKAISASKRKNDRLDARTLADLLRCDLFPQSYMPTPLIRELRTVLRYRTLLVREATRMKNKTAGLLMEAGAVYAKGRLHGKRYFATLIEELEDIPASVKELLKLSHSSMQVFKANQQRLLTELQRHPEISERVERLMTIESVGPVTALTWVLEVGDPHRLSSRKKAVSYCGLCSAQVESAGKSKRGPLSKQRNKHLQTVLIEAAKLAPRWNPQLARVYDTERQKGANHNRATLAVARKLVAYLLAVDKKGEPFQARYTA